MAKLKKLKKGLKKIAHISIQKVLCSLLDALKKENMKAFNYIQAYCVRSEVKQKLENIAQDETF